MKKCPWLCSLAFCVLFSGCVKQEPPVNGKTAAPGTTPQAAIPPAPASSSSLPSPSPAVTAPLVSNATSPAPAAVASPTVTTSPATALTGSATQTASPVTVASTAAPQAASVTNTSAQAAQAPSEGQDAVGTDAKLYEIRFGKVTGKEVSDWVRWLGTNWNRQADFMVSGKPLQFGDFHYVADGRKETGAFFVTPEGRCTPAECLISMYVELEYDVARPFSSVEIVPFFQITGSGGLACQYHHADLNKILVDGQVVYTGMTVRNGFEHKNDRTHAFGIHEIGHLKTGTFTFPEATGKILRVELTDSHGSDVDGGHKYTYGMGFAEITPRPDGGETTDTPEGNESADTVESNASGDNGGS